MSLTGFEAFDRLLSLFLLVLPVVVLVFAFVAREDAYRAAGKQTKKFWVLLLAAASAVAAAANVGVLGSLAVMLVLAGTVASIVFMVDVRPALKAVSGGGNRRGGSSSDGPYGPYNGGR